MRPAKSKHSIYGFIHLFRSNPHRMTHSSILIKEEDKSCSLTQSRSVNKATAKSENMTGPTKKEKMSLSDKLTRRRRQKSESARRCRQRHREEERLMHEKFEKDEARIRELEGSIASLFNELFPETDGNFEIFLTDSEDSSLNTSQRTM